MTLVHEFIGAPFIITELMIMNKGSDGQELILPSENSNTITKTNIWQVAGD
jgi:hypothetical protein